MNVTATTNSGTHAFVNGEWFPPITVSGAIHADALRKVNETALKFLFIRKLADLSTFRNQARQNEFHLDTLSVGNGRLLQKYWSACTKKLIRT